jgi:hypothetical protein
VSKTDSGSARGLPRWRLLFVALREWLRRRRRWLSIALLGLYAHVFGRLTTIDPGLVDRKRSTRGKYSSVLARLQASGTQLFRSDTLPVILLPRRLLFMPHPLAFTALVSVSLGVRQCKLIEATSATGAART